MAGKGRRALLWHLLCLISVVVAFPSRLHHPQGHYKKASKPYSFSYGVKDDYNGADFGQTEKSDGSSVTGSYSILLPDGRQQIVKYSADHHKGYVADVFYKGEAKFPPKSDKKPFVVKHNTGGGYEKPHVVPHKESPYPPKHQSSDYSPHPPRYQDPRTAGNLQYDIHEAEPHKPFHSNKHEQYSPPHQKEYLPHHEPEKYQPHKEQTYEPPHKESYPQPHQDSYSPPHIHEDIPPHKSAPYTPPHLAESHPPRPKKHVHPSPHATENYPRPHKQGDYKPPHQESSYPSYQEEIYAQPHQDESYPPPKKISPYEEDIHAPPHKIDSYKQSHELNYPPPPTKQYKPPIQESSYPPPPKKSNYPKPHQDEIYTPPHKQEGYPPPHEETSFQPPPKKQSYPPPHQESYPQPHHELSYLPPPKKQSYPTHEHEIHAFPHKQDEYKPHQEPDYSPPKKSSYPPPHEHAVYSAPQEELSYSPPHKQEKPHHKPEKYSPPHHSIQPERDSYPPHLPHQSHKPQGYPPIKPEKYIPHKEINTSPYPTKEHSVPHKHSYPPEDIHSSPHKVEYIPSKKPAKHHQVPHSSPPHHENPYSHPTRYPQPHKNDLEHRNPHEGPYSNPHQREINPLYPSELLEGEEEEGLSLGNQAAYIEPNYAEKREGEVILENPLPAMKEKENKERGAVFSPEKDDTIDTYELIEPFSDKLNTRPRPQKKYPIYPPESYLPKTRSKNQNPKKVTRQFTRQKKPSFKDDREYPLNKNTYSRHTQKEMTSSDQREEFPFIDDAYAPKQDQPLNKQMRESGISNSAPYNTRSEAFLPSPKSFYEEEISISEPSHYSEGVKSRGNGEISGNGAQERIDETEPILIDKEDIQKNPEDPELAIEEPFIQEAEERSITVEDDPLPTEDEEEFEETLEIQMPEGDALIDSEQKGTSDGTIELIELQDQPLEESNPLEDQPETQ